MNVFPQSSVGIILTTSIQNANIKVLLVYNLHWQRNAHFQWLFIFCDSLVTFTKRWKRKVYFSHSLLVYSTELQWKRISLKIKDNYWQASQIFLSDQPQKKNVKKEKRIYTNLLAGPLQNTKLYLSKNHDVSLSPLSIFKKF